jgi:CheY-like chemotaxis protein
VALAVHHKHGGMATVLLVEDNDDVREMISVALQLAGYDVVAARNGRAALDLLRERPRPCVILLDLMMPVMNGWEFRDALSREPQLQDVPVVVMSALDREMTQRAGAADYLEKPVDIDRLLEVVCEQCEGRPETCAKASSAVLRP